MAIWGKIVGGLAGFAIGGPLGGLLGAVSGHFWDRSRATQQGDSPNLKDFRSDDKQALFGLSLVALMAKMSKADGVVTRDEIERFRQLFNIDESNEKSVGKIFNHARQSTHGYQDYARQIYQIFGNRPEVLEILLLSLVSIALVDGVLHPNEKDFLLNVARIFKFTPAQVNAMVDDEIRYTKGGHRWQHSQSKNQYSGSQSDITRAYAILGVSPTDSDAHIKKAYHNLVRRHHPDQLMAQGVPKEAIDIANRKLASINDAYDQIQQYRKRHPVST